MGEIVTATAAGDAEPLMALAGMLAAFAGAAGLAAGLLAAWRSIERRGRAPGAGFCPWGILDILVGAIAYLGGYALSVAALSPWMKGQAQPAAWAVGVASGSAGAAGALVLLALLRRRYGLWLRDAGLTLERWGRDLLLALGLLVAVLAVRLPMSFIFNWLYKREGLEPQPQFLVERLTNSHDPLDLIVVAVAGILVAPIWEETAFRGFLQPFLRRYAGRGLALAAVAVAFSMIHDPRSDLLMVPAMVFPLAICILPNLFIVILGPIAINAWDVFTRAR